MIETVWLLRCQASMLWLVTFSYVEATGRIYSEAWSHLVEGYCLPWLSGWVPISFTLQRVSGLKPPPPWADRSQPPTSMCPISQLTNEPCHKWLAQPYIRIHMTRVSNPGLLSRGSGSTVMLFQLLLLVSHEDPVNPEHRSICTADTSPFRPSWMGCPKNVMSLSLACWQSCVDIGTGSSCQRRITCRYQIGPQCERLSQQWSGCTASEKLFLWRLAVVYTLLIQVQDCRHISTAFPPVTVGHSVMYCANCKSLILGCVMC